ncbi:hypothetical protein KAR91_82780 [Candidatus Pacearchaeota archaeon]|nr:hypothetical protein [Candidatus Pacearchaeota archaeon]
MKKIVFVLILFLAVTGCATTGYDDEEMSQYIGYQKDQLIIEFGVPTNEYTLDNGNKIIEYEKIETYSYGPNIATDISSVRFITDPDGIVIDYNTSFSTTW